MMFPTFRMFNVWKPSHVTFVAKRESTHSPGGVPVFDGTSEVRNSGVWAVVEGAGDHCCEYMTGHLVDNDTWRGVVGWDGVTS